MDLARSVFIAVHADDLIMVGSSSQQYDVVAGMKQHFTMKVSLPLSASSAQTYVGARYLRHGDTIWELPPTQYVPGMLGEAVQAPQKWSSRVLLKSTCSSFPGVIGWLCACDNTETVRNHHIRTLAIFSHQGTTFEENSDSH